MRLLLLQLVYKEDFYKDAEFFLKRKTQLGMKFIHQLRTPQKLLESNTEHFSTA